MNRRRLRFSDIAGPAFFIGCAVMVTGIVTAITYHFIQIYPEYLIVITMAVILGTVYALIYQEYAYWLSQRSKIQRGEIDEASDP